jgi:hypothetical protein
MENALRWRIEKAQKEIQRLQWEKKHTKNQYALGLIDGQIMGEQAKIADLEDMLTVYERLENQNKLREVI